MHKSNLYLDEVISYVKPKERTHLKAFLKQYPDIRDTALKLSCLLSTVIKNDRSPLSTEILINAFHFIQKRDAFLPSVESFSKTIEHFNNFVYKEIGILSQYVVSGIHHKSNKPLVWNPCEHSIIHWMTFIYPSSLLVVHHPDEQPSEKLANKIRSGYFERFDQVSLKAI